MYTILESLFSSSARVEILRLFLLNPGSQYYQREIGRESGQPIRAVQREVGRLEGIGLLHRLEEGNRVFYRLNPGFPLLAELIALVQKAYGAEPADQARFAPDPPLAQQPFAWFETPTVLPLPATMRHVQVGGEWDRAY